MTEWTPEEERVARAIVLASRDDPDATVPDSAYPLWWYFLPEARAAIAAMQPRWRDVKTDPPPKGRMVLTARAGEDGTNMCALFPDDEWVEYGSGRTTVTHHSFAPPTHWQFPPLPPAPEPKP